MHSSTPLQRPASTPHSGRRLGLGRPSQKGQFSSPLSSQQRKSLGQTESSPIPTKRKLEDENTIFDSLQSSEPAAKKSLTPLKDQANVQKWATSPTPKSKYKAKDVKKISPKLLLAVNSTQGEYKPHRPRLVVKKSCSQTQQQVFSTPKSSSPGPSNLPDVQTPDLPPQRFSPPPESPKTPANATISERKSKSAIHMRFRLSLSARKLQDVFDEKQRARRKKFREQEGPTLAEKLKVAAVEDQIDLTAASSKENSPEKPTGATIEEEIASLRAEIAEFERLDAEITETNRLKDIWIEGFRTAIEELSHATNRPITDLVRLYEIPPVLEPIVAEFF